MPPPARVALVVGNLETGGTQMLLMELMRRLPREVVDPELVFFKEPNHFAGEISSQGWKCHQVPVTRAMKVHEVKSLAGFFRDQRYDIVHTHSDFANFAGRMAALLAGRLPVAVHYHNTYEHRLNRGYLAAERMLAPHTDAYVACSSGVQDFIRERIDIAGRPLMLIRNGLDLTAFEEARHLWEEHRRRLGISPDEFHILHTARLEAHKQPALLIEAIHHGLSHGFEPPGPWRLTFLGGGGLKEELEALVGRLDDSLPVHLRGEMRRRIHFAGWSREVPAWLASANLFCLVSRNEGFSLSAVEAMAAGAPVLAPDIVGPREVVEDGRSGVLFRDPTPAGLWPHLETLWRDGRRRLALAAEGAERARLFGIGAFVRQTVDLYETLLRGTQPPPRPMGFLARHLDPWALQIYARSFRKKRQDG